VPPSSTVHVYCVAGQQGGVATCQIDLYVGPQVPDDTALSWWYQVVGGARRQGVFRYLGVRYQWTGVNLNKGTIGSSVGGYWQCPGDPPVGPEDLPGAQHEPFATGGFQTIEAGREAGCRLAWVDASHASG
jgi:hypothetical protein